MINLEKRPAVVCFPVSQVKEAFIIIPGSEFAPAPVFDFDADIIIILNFLEIDLFHGQEGPGLVVEGRGADGGWDSRRFVAFRPVGRGIG